MNIHNQIRNLLEAAESPGEGWYRINGNIWGKPPHSPLGPKPVRFSMSYDIDGVVRSAKVRMFRQSWVRGVKAFYWGYSVTVDTVEGWRLWGTVGSVPTQNYGQEVGEAQAKAKLPEIKVGTRLRFRDLVVVPWKDGVYQASGDGWFGLQGPKLHGVITGQSRPTEVRVGNHMARWGEAPGSMAKAGWDLRIKRTGGWEDYK